MILQGHLNLAKYRGHFEEEGILLFSACGRTIQNSMSEGREGNQREKIGRVWKRREPKVSVIKSKIV